MTLNCSSGVVVKLASCHQISTWLKPHLLREMRRRLRAPLVSIECTGWYTKTKNMLIQLTAGSVGDCDHPPTQPEKLGCNTWSSGPRTLGSLVARFVPQPTTVMCCTASPPPLGDRNQRLLGSDVFTPSSGQAAVMGGGESLLQPRLNT